MTLNWMDVRAVSAGVTTATSPVLAFGGTIASMELGERRLNVAATPANLIELTWSRFEPLITTAQS